MFIAAGAGIRFVFENHEIQLIASFKHTLRLLNKFHKCYLLKLSET